VVDAELIRTAPEEPEPTDDSRASLVLGLLLLAADEVRATLDAAREELRGATERRTTAGTSGTAATSSGTSSGGAPGGVRWPLIGAVLDIQHHVVVVGAGLGRPWWRGAGQTMVWAWKAPLLGGVRARVEAEGARLSRIGAEGEARARQLAAATVSAAVHRVTDGLLDQEFEDAYQRAIARMLETPEIAELVREQSAGLAQELATSVRERAVTGDDLAERLIRRLLRRGGGIGAPAPIPRVDEVQAET
jgi:hypothetical protein